jgi:excinuclease ABC subunit C
MKLDLELPTQPGVYRFYNKDGELIYIGKAKNLSRRISQYRNARRCKAHAKMRKIKKEATRLEFEICENEFWALKLENELIQKHRPKWNVAGAFYFLYPMVGLKIGVGDQAGEFFICYTTTPEEYPAFEFHGAYRSRLRTKTAFFSLIELLGMIGHPIPRSKIQKQGIAGAPKKFDYVYGFRQIPKDWMPLLDPFLSGDNFLAIEELSLLLLEKPGALARSSETQEHLRELRKFWRHEIQPLKRAREHSSHNDYPVKQKERDSLFIALMVQNTPS